MDEITLGEEGARKGPGQRCKESGEGLSLIRRWETRRKRARDFEPAGRFRGLGAAAKEGGKLTENAWSRKRSARTYVKTGRWATEEGKIEVSLLIALRKYSGRPGGTCMTSSCRKPKSSGEGPGPCLNGGEGGTEGGSILDHHSGSNGEITNPGAARMRSIEKCDRGRGKGKLRRDRKNLWVKKSSRS